MCMCICECDGMYYRESCRIMSPSWWSLLHNHQRIDWWLFWGYLGFSQTSMMEFFAKIINNFNCSNYFLKQDVCLSSKCVSKSSRILLTQWTKHVQSNKDTRSVSINILFSCVFCCWLWTGIYSLRQLIVNWLRTIFVSFCITSLTTKHDVPVSLDSQLFDKYTQYDIKWKLFLQRNFILRYFNFEPSFRLRWCFAQFLFGSQIPLTSRGFKLRISCIQSIDLTH